MPDEPKKGKKSLAVVAVVLVLCAVVAAWLVFISRHAKTNMPPIAALRLDFLDETNRVVRLSDNGSHDPDGTIRSWRIAWGDDKEDQLSSVPQEAAHTYASEGEYTISLWCVDNYGATSSPPAMTNIIFDFLKRQKALEQAQAEAKREADRLKEEQARKEAERLEQEKQKEMAAEEARKQKEQRELEEKQKADAEAAMVQQKALEAQEAAKPPPPTPLAAGLPDNPSSLKVIYTPPGYTLGEFQIFKEKTEGMESGGNLLVILVIRCVNFPNTPIATSDWQIDGKDVQVPAGRIRASLSPGPHDLTALLTRKAGAGPTELKAAVTVQSGDCVVKPGK